MDKVKVKIFKAGYIPGIGAGPMRIPVWISREKYENLIKLGFKVHVVEDSRDTKAPSIVTPTVDPVVPETKVEEKTTEETPVVEAKPVEETKVEVVTAIEEDESAVITNDKDLSAESVYTESFLTSRNVCKKILNARGVQYDADASASVLKKLVLSSNPDATSEEEVVEEEVSE